MLRSARVRLVSWKPAVLAVLVCSASVTGGGAAHVEFTRASSSDDKASSSRGVKAAAGPGAGSIGRAHSFPTAFLRSRAPKGKSTLAGDTKASSSGLICPCAVAPSSTSSAVRLTPTFPAHPRTTADRDAGGLRMTATRKARAASKVAKEAGKTEAGAEEQRATVMHLVDDSRSVRAPGAKRFVMLRHGQTDFNAEGRVQGSSDDSRLSEQGVKQAKEAGAFLKQFTFDKTYVSPLNRARETLRTVGEVTGAEGAGKEAVVDEDLREIDLYEWQGLLKTEIKENFSEDYLKWRGEGAASFRLPSGNYPVVQLWARARSVWERVLAEAAEEGAGDGQDGSLIVAHNAIIQAMLCNAMGLGEESFRKFEVPNCGVFELEWVPGEAVARRWRWLFPTEDTEWHTPGDYLPEKQSADAESKKEILGRASLRSVSLDRSTSELSDFGS